uniref:Uncharacterized protein n=1 Tax=Kalanchoe fedtschenkoi TaxID=63787 RepID=A0A7N0UC90_KALFE
MGSSKARSWRKKAGDVADPRSNGALRQSGDEVNMHLDDKVALETELQRLNDKLLSAESENRAKDDLVKKHVRVAQEAIAGWEKAESEALSVKETLGLALQQYTVSEERCDHLDGALKECMHQLRFVHETKAVLEEEKSENSKRMSRLGVENTGLNEALMLKDKMILEMRELKTRAEANCKSLMTRLEKNKKDNASLKYEIRVLEKELEIRNEEREFIRRAADASHRKQLENVKKLRKLESECQRLRVLVRKRLPGPVALAKMKDEVAMLEKDSAQNRQRRLTELPVDVSLDTPSYQRINSLAKDLYALEEENSNLKKIINTKVNELQMFRVRSECETEVGSTNHLNEANNFLFSRDQGSPNFSALHGRNVLFEDSPREGNLEAKLQDAIDQCNSLQREHQMSEKTIISLQKQLEIFKESKRLAEDQTERHMFANEELHSQLTEARVDLNEAFQKTAALEVKLENKSTYCEDLEATCVELRLQLQSFRKIGKCQGTILNLGKQLKAMASPKEGPLFDKVLISTPPDPMITAIITNAPAVPTTPIKKTENRQRTSLLETMLAEDDAQASAFAPKTKEMVTTSTLPALRTV